MKTSTIVLAAKITSPIQLYRAAVKVSKHDSKAMYPTMNIVPIEQQEDDSCVLVSIQMVASFYGIEASEARIEAAYKDHYQRNGTGTTYSDAFNFLKWLGLDAHWTKVTSEVLSGYVRQNIPVICDLRMHEELGHAMVVSGEDNTYLYFADPNIGQFIKIPKRYVDSIMSDTSFAAIAVKPGKITHLSI